MIWILTGAILLLALVYLLVVRPAAERDRAKVLLREERLDISKTREELADVTTHTEVFREMKTVTVPVTSEELVVEKDGVEAARIPLREERVDVAARMVPLNDVSVYRRAWEEEKAVQAVLKKEVARVETTGDAANRMVPPGATEPPPTPQTQHPPQP